MRGFGLQRQRPVADQLRIAAVLLRKIGRWMPQYAHRQIANLRFGKNTMLLPHISDKYSLSEMERKSGQKSIRQNDNAENFRNNV